MLTYSKFDRVCNFKSLKLVKQKVNWCFKLIHMFLSKASEDLMSLHHEVKEQIQYLKILKQESKRENLQS